MDVGRPRDGVDACAHGPDRITLTDHRSLPRRPRAELEQRDGVPVGGSNRDGTTPAGDRAREGHRARRRRSDGCADFRSDVDAAVLPAGVRIVAERERAQDRAVDRPAPCPRVGGEGKEQGDHEGDDPDAEASETR
jgi:hypothetical protein